MLATISAAVALTVALTVLAVMPITRLTGARVLDLVQTMPAFSDT